ncbi:hypothetical protein Tco_1575155, partial [Tanacetum coccineum]
SQLLLTASEHQRDGVKKFETASGLNRHSEALEDLPKRRRRDYTPFVSPFLDSDDESDDGEVLNELDEYGNAGNVLLKFVAYFDSFLPMKIITRKAYNTIMVEGLESTGRNLVAVVRDVYVFVGSFTYVTDFVVLEDIGEFIVSDMADVVMGRPFRDVIQLEYDYIKGLISTWMAFGGNTRDLGSFGEETNEITTLHQSRRRKGHTDPGNGVTITCDGVKTSKRRYHSLTILNCLGATHKKREAFIFANYTIEKEEFLDIVKVAKLEEWNLFQRVSNLKKKLDVAQTAVENDPHNLVLRGEAIDVLE